MSSIIDRGTYFTNLPREHYVSESIFRQEMERVFRRQWLLVGHESSARRKGDYFVKQVGNESLIIMRDDKNALHAYFNVCRHRGSRILADGAKGCSQRLTCPYHAWTYDLTGALRAVPSAKSGEHFDFAEWPLHEAHCETWYGWVFVYLDETPGPSLKEQLEPMTRASLMQQAESSRLTLAHRETYIVNANWKVLAENNSECYHCGVAHPSLSISCNHAAFYGESADKAHFPLHPGMKTFSMDGARVCTKALGPREAFSAGFLNLPLFCGPVFFVDHAVSLELTPLTVDRTQLICEWYVHEEAVEDVDYNREALTKVFHVTNLEDCRLSEATWRGMQSARFRAGPLHPHMEVMVGQTLNEYLRMMATP